MKKFALRGMVILAIVVALCIFFSGTIRTLTTPKVRFAQAKMGKMEQETQLTGKVVFPETEELKLEIPEGLSLTVTRVHVAAGDQVKAGETLLTTKVTDAEKTLESLRKESATAQKELRTLEKKTAEVRLTRGEQSWQVAWEREDGAREAEREARVNLAAALRQENLTWNGEETLPEGASEAAAALFEAWGQAAEELTEAGAELAALERYAIPEETWTALQQKKEAQQKLADLETQMTTLQVLQKTMEKIPAPRAMYIAEISLEKGATIDGDTVVLKMTAEGSAPVIRVDLSEVKQEVKPGASISLEADTWSRPTVKIINTGLTNEGHPYGDAEITKDAIYALGSVGTMMKNELKARMTTRSQDATCLLPASAVRGSGDSRYVYVGQSEGSAFGGSRMVAQKMDVTVLAESGSTVSIAEDLTYQKVLYMEDRALTEGGAVMEYTKDAGK
ncbi:MAG: hypothetical protein IJ188_03710 [Clostridia bacterium]|nr:hypothetical protein [Clostridia bacterium]